MSLTSPVVWEHDPEEERVHEQARQQRQAQGHPSQHASPPQRRVAQHAAVRVVSTNHIMSCHVVSYHVKIKGGMEKQRRDDEKYQRDKEHISEYHA